jgi:hypothetical protein
MEVSPWQRQSLQPTVPRIRQDMAGQIDPLQLDYLP